MPLALFDMDGTVWDSQNVLQRTYEMIQKEMAFGPKDLRLALQYSGVAVEESVAYLAPELQGPQREVFCRRWKEILLELKESSVGNVRFFKGIEEVLRDLKKSGWILGIATAASERMVASVLRPAGLLDLFSTRQTGDIFPAKPSVEVVKRALQETHVAPPAAVMIGDTQTDMQMARQGGIYALGVGWGLFDLESLQQAGAQKTAEHVYDLPAVLRSFFEKDV